MGFAKSSWSQNKIGVSTLFNVEIYTSYRLPIWLLVSYIDGKDTNFYVGPFKTKCYTIVLHFNFPTYPQNSCLVGGGGGRGATPKYVKKYLVAKRLVAKYLITTSGKARSYYRRDVIYNK